MSSTPRAASTPVPAATDSAAASVGPRHGVQPSANTPPSSGAPSQVVQRFGLIRVSFCSTGTMPMNTRPMMMVTTPPIRMRVSALRVSMLIAPNTVTVARTNTTVKPRMNIKAAPATAHCRFFVTTAPCSASGRTSPPTTPAR